MQRICGPFVTKTIIMPFVKFVACDTFLSDLCILGPVYMKVGDTRKVRKHVVGYPTWHVNVITLNWGIVWTVGLPHLSGLPYLPSLPHLHVNRSLFKFIFLYLCYIPPHSCTFHTICFTPIFSFMYITTRNIIFSYPRWCGWPGKARN